MQSSRSPSLRVPKTHDTTPTRAPTRRTWRHYVGFDADRGFDAPFDGEFEIKNTEDLKEYCEFKGYGGFLIFGGEAFFRSASAENLLTKRNESMHRVAKDERVVLWLGFEAPSCLRDPTGKAALVEKSSGRWLDRSDFVFGLPDQMVLGLRSLDDIGSHGLPRNWPTVWSQSATLKKMFGKKGAMPGKKVEKSSAPGATSKNRVNDLNLIPLLSFDNATLVQSVTGWRIVQGWALYELVNQENGAAYVAVKHWWNKNDHGNWVDFTPRPPSVPDLVLVEAQVSESRDRCVLTQYQFDLGERLMRLRWKDFSEGDMLCQAPPQAEQKAKAQVTSDKDAQGELEPKVIVKAREEARLRLEAEAQAKDEIQTVKARHPGSLNNDQFGRDLRRKNAIAKAEENEQARSYQTMKSSLGQIWGELGVGHAALEVSKKVIEEERKTAGEEAPLRAHADRRLVVDEEAHPKDVETNLNVAEEDRRKHDDAEVKEGVHAAARLKADEELQQEEETTQPNAAEEERKTAGEEAQLRAHADRRLVVDEEAHPKNVETNLNAAEEERRETDAEVKEEADAAARLKADEELQQEEAQPNAAEEERKTACEEAEVSSHADRILVADEEAHPKDVEANLKALEEERRKADVEMNEGADAAARLKSDEELQQKEKETEPNAAEEERRKADAEVKEGADAEARLKADEELLQEEADEELLQEEEITQPNAAEEELRKAGEEAKKRADEDARLRGYEKATQEDELAKLETAEDMLLEFKALEEAQKRSDEALEEQKRVAEEEKARLKYAEDVVSDIRNGIQDAIEEAVRLAEADHDGAVRRNMVCAGIVDAICNATSEALARSKHGATAVRLLALLIGDDNMFCSTAGNMPSALANELIEHMILPSLSAQSAQSAVDSAVVLAWVCYKNVLVLQLARILNAPRCLVHFFNRHDLTEEGRRAAQDFWNLLDEGSTDDTPSSGTSCHGTWNELYRRCYDTLRETHSRESPRNRRALSWSRTLSFAKVALGYHGCELRQGTADQPFIIWVLGAVDQVEAELVREGLFSGSNWVDSAPTEVFIFGDQLQEIDLHENTGAVHTFSYEALPRIKQMGASPDFVAVFMPPIMKDTTERTSIPDQALAMIGDTPAVISTRFAMSEDHRIALRHRFREGSKLLLSPMRCPFSSSAGSSSVPFADNGWVFAVQGSAALNQVLNLNLPLRLFPSHAKKKNVIFWGILDIKYDTARPVLERVQVLETGDGRSSKFSGDGKAILDCYNQCYQLKNDPGLTMDQLISADKKLTHDLMQQAGYGHIIPEQVCLPRQYEEDLEERIARALRLNDADYVVLKLCNRSRGAGVVISPVAELDDVLSDLLTGPEDVESWVKKQCGDGDLPDLRFSESSFAEHMRHWWSNESPVFVAERWSTSSPTERDGHLFDGTLRVGFVLRRKEPPQPDETDTSPSKSPPWLDEKFYTSRESPGSEKKRTESSGQLAPEDLEVDWLGAYWKLPSTPIDSERLRERVVSAARTSGTSTISSNQLLEVYAALGDSIQQVLGSAEPTPNELVEKYRHQPDLAAYLMARLGTHRMFQDMRVCERMLYSAEDVLRNPGSASESCVRSVKSFICRARGILQGKIHPDWANTLALWEKSLEHLPTNATTLYLLGYGFMQRDSLEDAAKHLRSALALDPDFKSTYVMLSITYLRLGRYEHTKKLSELCLNRHPDCLPSQYHLAVACCQLALAIESQGAEQWQIVAEDAHLLRKRSLTAFNNVRARTCPKKRVGEPPWLPVDDDMVDAMNEHIDGSSQRVQLPPWIGWQSIQYRIR